MQRPFAHNFLSTYEFVQAYDLWAQRHRKGYSKRNFARWAQIQSPNFISLVVSQKRLLKGAWLRGFVKAAQLTAEEIVHLEKLSAFENAKTASKREKLLEEVRQALVRHDMKSLASDQLEVLSQPNIWTLLHMLDLKGQNASPIWFKKRLRFLEMSGKEISSAFKLLKRLGLVDESEGQLKSKDKILQSPDQVKSGSNANYHRLVLQEAAEALQKLDYTERAFGSMTATVADEKLDDLKKEINKFGRYITAKYASREVVSGELVRLNIQLYPLTLRKERK